MEECVKMNECMYVCMEIQKALKTGKDNDVQCGKPEKNVFHLKSTVRIFKFHFFPLNDISKVNDTYFKKESILKYFLLLHLNLYMYSI